MFSRLIKLTFFGCFLIAASVPAEAGIFDRILKRKGGRAVGCCSPQKACAQAQCAPAPCAEPSCRQLYRENLEVCQLLFGDNQENCKACQAVAREAYCECLSDPGSPRLYKVPCAAHPMEPTVAACAKFKEDCESLAGGPNNCASCYFECLKLIPAR